MRKDLWVVWLGVGVAAASWVALGHAPASWAITAVVLLGAIAANRKSLHGEAVVCASVAALQTVATFDGVSSASLVSLALTAATLAVVFLSKVPELVVWVVLGANTVSTGLYVGHSDNLAGAALYGALLFPFVSRVAAVVLTLVARHRNAPNALGPGPARPVPT